MEQRHLSVDGGEGSYTFSIAAGGDPDGKFAISGSNLNLADTLDFESATSHQVTIEADNGVDTPVARLVTITVTNAFEEPDLGALTLSGPFEQGATVEIVGATEGSVITGLTLPTGWTLDGAAREITIAAGAPIGAQSWALLETLADSSNSPRTTNGSSTVTAANAARPMIVVMVAGQSNPQGTAAAGAQDQNVSGVFQYVSNPAEGNPNTISSNIVPLHHPRASGTSPANIGLGDYWARRIFASDIVPAGYDLLIVPYARGSTGMITGGEEWKPTDPLGELAQGAINQCTAAVNAAQAIHPDSRFVGFLWGQGENETNNGGGRDAYMAAFLQLRDLIRAQVPTASACWAMIASMVPEWVKTSPAPLPIQQAHMRLAFENEGIYFDQAPVGLGDAPNNTIHYDADGYRSYGAQLGDASPDLIADPRVVYDFRGDEIGDGAAANSDELLGTYQQGATRLTLQNGASAGLGSKCITAAAAPNGIGGAGIEFLPNTNAADVSLEFAANLAGRQSITLRASGSYGFFGFDGYLFRIDDDNTVTLFDVTNAGLTNITPDTATKPMGVAGTTARFRASAIGTRLTFEVSNDNGDTWATVLDTTNSAHASGRIAYMQGGDGTTGGQIFAENFAIRPAVPV